MRWIIETLIYSENCKHLAMVCVVCKMYDTRSATQTVRSEAQSCWSCSGRHRHAEIHLLNTMENIAHCLTEGLEGTGWKVGGSYLVCKNLSLAPRTEPVQGRWSSHQRLATTGYPSDCVPLVHRIDSSSSSIAGNHIRPSVKCEDNIMFDVCVRRRKRCRSRRFQSTNWRLVIVMDEVMWVGGIE